jgi:hypothetical protein
VAYPLGRGNIETALRHAAVGVICTTIVIRTALTDTIATRRTSATTVQTRSKFDRRGSQTQVRGRQAFCQHSFPFPWTVSIGLWYN